MTANLMAALHPDLPAGEFDVLALLQHEPPNDWRPQEVGDFVYGVVTKIEQGQRADYTFPIVYLLAPGKQLVRVRCSAVMLRKQVADLGVRSGKVISVAFTGSKFNQAKTREYRTFTVRSL